MGRRRRYSSAGHIRLVAARPRVEARAARGSSVSEREPDDADEDETAGDDEVEAQDPHPGLRRERQLGWRQRGQRRHTPSVAVERGDIHGRGRLGPAVPAQSHDHERDDHGRGAAPDQNDEDGLNVRRVWEKDRDG